MIQRKFVIALLSALLVTACALRPALHPYAGTLPARSSLDMSGTFALTPAGELTLALRTGCVSTQLRRDRTVKSGCGKAERDLIRVIAVTPWNTQVSGTWIGPRQIVFHVDWHTAQLDVLASDALAHAGRRWTVSGIDWEPTTDDAQRILELIGEATGNEVTLVRGGAPPGLDVSMAEVVGGALHVGEKATLSVKIANRGPGTAYRVVATTRSSIDSLHAQRLSFGMIQPGGEKIRTLDVTVPVGETAPDTMVVLSVAEGNGFAPSAISRRLPIAAPQGTARLAVRCSIPDHPGARPDLAAGSRLLVRCGVDNTGSVAAKVELETAVGDSTPSRAMWKDHGANTQSADVGPGGRAAMDISVAIPRDLPIDTPAEIVITARDRQSSVTARTALVGMIRKPRLCVPGELTRAQYKMKLASLREAVGSGDLTQAQLDRYDAELVSCLK